MKLKLKWRIILPVSGILSALVIATVVFSTMKFNNYTQILFNERIAVAANGLKNFISDCEQDTRIAAISNAANIDIVNAINNKDTENLRRLLLSLLDTYHVDSLIVTDGKVIGAISAGIQLDANDLVDQLKRQYDADFSVFIDNKRIATTIFRDDERILGSPLDPKMAEYFNSNKTEYHGVVDIEGESYSIFCLPLLDGEGEIFATIVTGSSNASLVLEKNALLKSIVIIGLLGLAISIFILLLITSRFVKPVKQLTRLVSDFTHGNIPVYIKKLWTM